MSQDNEEWKDLSKKEDGSADQIDSEHDRQIDKIHVWGNQPV